MLQSDEGKDSKRFRAQSANTSQDLTKFHNSITYISLSVVSNKYSLLVNFNFFINLLPSRLMEQ